jgi:hypothetical protein
MSIDTILDHLLAVGRLVELPSLFTGDETARMIVVSPDILAAVSPPFPETEQGQRRQEFRHWLDAFSEGGEISVAQNPRQKPPEAMLARVEPVGEEFWSIRVTDPDSTPGIRAFGAFLGKDKFVALTWEYREQIGADFDDEVTSVREMWCDLFGEEPPFFGDTLDEYLTNYIAV